MHLKKVFLTSELPGDLAEWLVKQEFFVEDGYTSHVIGYFVGEAALSPDDYDYADVGMMCVLDDFLCCHGASDGEEVLIEHG